MSFLPFDYSRCNGKPAGPQGLNVAPECLTCARRLAPWGDRQSVMEPSKETPCPNRIPSEEMGS